MPIGASPGWSPSFQKWLASHPIHGRNAGVVTTTITAVASDAASAAATTTTTNGRNNGVAAMPASPQSRSFVVLLPMGKGLGMDVKWVGVRGRSKPKSSSDGGADDCTAAIGSGGGTASGGSGSRSGSGTVRVLTTAAEKATAGLCRGRVVVEGFSGDFQERERRRQRQRGWGGVGELQVGVAEANGGIGVNDGILAVNGVNVSGMGSIDDLLAASACPWARTVSPSPTSACAARPSPPWARPSRQRRPCRGCSC